jgi:peptide/nickel transport system permease protein
MFAYVVRRLVGSVPVVVLASVLVFGMVALSGDPLAQWRAKNPPVPPAVIHAKAHELGLDRPFWVRYWRWASHFVRGDFGQSVAGSDVRHDLWVRMGVTLRMVLLATVLAVGIAIVVGVIGALRQYSLTDNTLTIAGFVLLSMPVFWLAVLLKQFFAVDLNRLLGRTVVYTIGDHSPNLTGSAWTKTLDYAGHLALPTLTLVLVSVAGYSRFQRDSMLEVLNADYVRQAMAKGLPRRRVIVRHALRTALIPMTTLVALNVGAVIGGAVVTEAVFDWQGMGLYLLQSIQSNDVNATTAWLMVTAAFVIVFNLAADVLYCVLDPRIRLT